MVPDVADQRRFEMELAVVLSTDLLITSQLAGTLAQQGLQLQTAADLHSVNEWATDRPIDLLILDLLHPELADVAKVVPQLRSLPHAPRQLVAYTQHVQVERLKRARAAGIDLVTTRGQLIAALQQLLA